MAAGALWVASFACAASNPPSRPRDATTVHASADASPVHAVAETAVPASRAVASDRTHHFARPAQWPPALLFPSIYDPGDASVSSGEGGDLRVTHHLADASYPEVAATWGEVLENGGFTRVAPCVEAPRHSCAWVGHDRRVGVDIGANGNGEVEATVQWLPVGHQPVSSLPGPCVKPPAQTREILVTSSGVDQQGEFRQASVRWLLSTTPLIDLDGDGQLDVVVPHAKDGTCPWEVPHDAYVMRGSCGHRIGTFVGFVDASSHVAGFDHGLRELHTAASWATRGGASLVPDHHTRSRRYAFDGQALRVVDDATRSGRCHHCSVSHCAAP